MREKVNLLRGSVLRGFQMLFAIVVLGLSATLGKDQKHGWGNIASAPPPPAILSLVTGIGALSLVAAVFSLTIAWTNLLREYIEMLVDLVVVVINMVCGVVIAIKLQGKNCGDDSQENQVGNTQYPYKGALGAIDLVNGGCAKNEQTEPMEWNRTDSVFMFLTVVVCFGAMALTFLRMRKST